MHVHSLDMHLYTYMYVSACTVEPQFYDRWFNDIPNLMINIHFSCCNDIISITYSKRVTNTLNYKKFYLKL